MTSQVIPQTLDEMVALAAATLQSSPEVQAANRAAFRRLLAPFQGRPGEAALHLAALMDEWEALQGAYSGQCGEGYWTAGEWDELRARFGGPQ